MALFEWNKSLSVNVAEIDRQHQKLVALINELTDDMQQGKSRELIGGIIADLEDYARYHFATEEKYFDQLNYPFAPTHKMEHNNFVAKVAAFKKKYQNGSLIVSIEMMNFLKDWVLDHLKGSDQRYSKFFNDKGLF